MQKPVRPHKFLKAQFRNGQRKWQKKIKEAQYFHSLPKMPRLRRLLQNKNKKEILAEEALTKLYHEQRSLVTWLQLIKKTWMRNVNQENNHRNTIVVQDLATQWIQSYPCKNKTSQETQKSLQKFLEPERKPKVIYTDNSLEFGKACEDLSWNHCTSTPHRSETNGIAERAVRRVKEGTSAVLLQSGLNESWWADSVECYTYLRNVTDLLSDGKTPHERRFGQPFKGPIIPFGSLVEYHPITAKDQSRIH